MPSIPSDKDRCTKEKKAIQRHLADLLYFRNALQDWYGANWKKFDEIFENKIKRLEKELEK